MTRLIAAVAVLVMVVSGCSKAVAGEPAPNAEAVKEASSPLTAEKALGELTTLDYCSLIDVYELPKDVGEVSMSGVPTLDYCFFIMRVRGTRIEGQVGLLEDKDSIAEIDRTEDRQRKPPRGLKVQRGEESDAACVRFLQFADDVWLTITAEVQDPDAPDGDWCPLADATVDMIIERMDTPHVRHFTFEANSVGALNACDLVKSEVVAAKLGERKVDEQRYLSGHECSWGGSSDIGAYARLVFDVRPTDLEDVKVETIAGRPTRVSSMPAAPDDSFSACLLETEHIKSTVFLTNELVDLEVALPSKGKDACGLARELAKEIWAKLPKS